MTSTGSGSPCQCLAARRPRWRGQVALLTFAIAATQLTLGAAEAADFREAEELIYEQRARAGRVASSHTSIVRSPRSPHSHHTHHHQHEEREARRLSPDADRQEVLVHADGSTHSKTSSSSLQKHKEDDDSGAPAASGLDEEVEEEDAADDAVQAELQTLHNEERALRAENGRLRRQLEDLRADSSSRHAHAAAVASAGASTPQQHQQQQLQQKEQQKLQQKQAEDDEADEDDGDNDADDDEQDLVEEKQQSSGGSQHPQSVVHPVAASSREPVRKLAVEAISTVTRPPIPEHHRRHQHHHHAAERAALKDKVDSSWTFDPSKCDADANTHCSSWLRFCTCKNPEQGEEQSCHLYMPYVHKHCQTTCGKEGIRCPRAANSCSDSPNMLPANLSSNPPRTHSECYTWKHKKCPTTTDPDNSCNYCSPCGGNGWVRTVCKATCGLCDSNVAATTQAPSSSLMSGEFMQASDCGDQFEQ
mmetsp:Transcript_10787/g.24644  ORF Transcript_10787/g.24644 Transcript_10787/m.24644 type:complete len:476 (-) Transcript_10787:140-1567(-)